MSIVYPTLRNSTFVLKDAMFRTAARPTHGGVDFTPVIAGKHEPLYAVESGVITISGWSKTAGKNVMISTKSGRKWWYGHMSDYTVKVGQTVLAGDHIGFMGNTGNSFGVHLHLELHYPVMNAEVDPWLYIWNAPDIKGQTFPPAESREKALTEYSNYTNEEGPFMALTDYEQKEILNTVKDIRAALRVPNAVYDWLPALNNKIEAIAKNAQAANDALNKPIDGFAPIDVIRTHSIAILKAVNAAAAAQGVTLDEEALKNSILDELGKAIVERD